MSDLKKENPDINIWIEWVNDFNERFKNIYSTDEPVSLEHLEPENELTKSVFYTSDRILN